MPVTDRFRARAMARRTLCRLPARPRAWALLHRLLRAVDAAALLWRRHGSELDWRPGALCAGGEADAAALAALSVHRHSLASLGRLSGRVAVLSVTRRLCRKSA